MGEVLNKRNCPLCGHSVHPINVSIGDVLSAIFKCSGCGAEFSANVKGGLIERTVIIEIEKPSVGVCGESPSIRKGWWR